MVTNYDHVRALNEDELVEFVLKVNEEFLNKEYCEHCICHNRPECNEDRCRDMTPEKILREWLGMRYNNWEVTTL